MWWQTKYLLSGSSNDEALRLPDQFLEQHSERLVTNPLKRPLFQHDLLAVYGLRASPFDEPTPARTGLQNRVAEIIRRLPLSEDQIRKLPDNYDDAIRAHLFPTASDPADPQRPFFPLTFSIPRDCEYVLAKRTDALLPLIT